MGFLLLSHVGLLRQRGRQLISRRDKEIGGVYCDLCFSMPVRNSLVGEEFTDAFGRDIPSRLSVFELRECLMRMWNRWQSEQSPLCASQSGRVRGTLEGRLLGRSVQAMLRSDLVSTTRRSGDRPRSITKAPKWMRDRR